MVYSQSRLDEALAVFKADQQQEEWDALQKIKLYQYREKFNLRRPVPSTFDKPCVGTWHAWDVDTGDDEYQPQVTKRPRKRNSPTVSTKAIARNRRRTRSTRTIRRGPRLFKGAAIQKVHNALSTVAERFLTWYRDNRDLVAKHLDERESAWFDAGDQRSNQRYISAKLSQSQMLNMLALKWRANETKGLSVTTKFDEVLFPHYGREAKAQLTRLTDSLHREQVRKEKADGGAGSESEKTALQCADAGSNLEHGHQDEDFGLRIVNQTHGNAQPEGTIHQPQGTAASHYNSTPHNKITEMTLPVKRFNNVPVQTFHITTAFAHPIRFNTQRRPCPFCKEYRFAVTGHGHPRAIRVSIDVEPRSGSKLYREHDLTGYANKHPATKMCQSCTTRRLRMIQCRPHQMTRIPGAIKALKFINANRQQYQADLHSTQPDRSRRPPAPLNAICSLCPNPALWKCCTQQYSRWSDQESARLSSRPVESVGPVKPVEPVEHLKPTEDHLTSPQGLVTNKFPNSTECIPISIQGCGLHVCDTCRAFVEHSKGVLDNEAREWFEKWQAHRLRETGRWRADADLLFEGSLLWNACVSGGPRE